MFARDCYNALEVSTKTKHIEKIDYFLKRCLKQGIEFNYLEQQKMLNDYKKTYLWSKLILAKDSLLNIYENNVNWEIRKEIIEMFTEDQLVRDLAHKNRFNLFKIKQTF